MRAPPRAPLLAAPQQQVQAERKREHDQRDQRDHHERQRYRKWERRMHSSGSPSSKRLSENSSKTDSRRRTASGNVTMKAD